MVNENNNEPENGGILKTSGLLFLEIVKIALIAAVIVFLIRYFLIQPFFVKGASMEPNFSDGQYLIVDELSYKIRVPARGDVIVFRYPRDTKQFYIKRIIGLPGEGVEIKNNNIIISDPASPDGQILQEDYLPEGEVTFPNRKWQLKDNEYFVMGDNRVASSDSRTWGPLHEKFIIGRVFIRAFPVEKFMVFKTEEGNIPN